MSIIIIRKLIRTIQSNNRVLGLGIHAQIALLNDTQSSLEIYLWTPIVEFQSHLRYFSKKEVARSASTGNFFPTITSAWFCHRSYPTLLIHKLLLSLSSQSSTAALTTLLEIPFDFLSPSALPPSTLHIIPLPQSRAWQQSASRSKLLTWQRTSMRMLPS